MSDYIKVRAMRCRITPKLLKIWKKKFDIKEPDELCVIPSLSPYFYKYRDIKKGETPKFNITYTISDNYETDIFLDLLFERIYGDESSDYGKIRKLYREEINEFLPIWEKVFGEECFADEKVIGELDSMFRMVEYCWYNSSEPLNYFDEIKDDFYQPAHNLWKDFYDSSCS